MDKSLLSIFVDTIKMLMQSCQVICPIEEDKSDRSLYLLQIELFIIFSKYYINRKLLVIIVFINSFNNVKKWKDGKIKYFLFLKFYYLVCDW